MIDLSRGGKRDDRMVGARPQMSTLMQRSFGEKKND